jgi:hypothetical protein
LTLSAIIIKLLIIKTYLIIFIAILGSIPALGKDPITINGNLHISIPPGSQNIEGLYLRPYDAIGETERGKLYPLIFEDQEEKERVYKLANEELMKHKDSLNNQEITSLPEPYIYLTVEVMEEGGDMFGPPLKIVTPIQESIILPTGPMPNDHHHHHECLGNTCRGGDCKLHH